MIENNGAVRKIVFATDFSSASRRVVPYLADVAVKTKAAVLGTYAFAAPRALDSEVGPPREWLSKLRREYTGRLENFFVHPRLQGVKLELKLHEGLPQEAISKLLDREKADLSMVATHGQASLESFFLGADLERLLRLGDHPVWVVPEQGLMTVEWNPILCAVDFSPASMKALRFAVQLVNRYGKSLSVVHVVDLENDGETREPVQAILDWRIQKIRRLLSDYGAPRDTGVVVRQGHPARNLLDAAREFGSDLLLMGIHGGRLHEVLGLGTVSRAVLRSGSFPVLLFPATESVVTH